MEEDQPARRVIRDRTGAIVFADTARRRQKGPDGKLLPLYTISPADARRKAAQHAVVQQPTIPWMLSYGGWAYTRRDEAASALT